MLRCIAFTRTFVKAVPGLWQYRGLSVTVVYFVVGIWLVIWWVSPRVPLDALILGQVDRDTYPLKRHGHLFLERCGFDPAITASLRRSNVWVKPGTYGQPGELPYSPLKSYINGCVCQRTPSWKKRFKWFLWLICQSICLKKKNT